MWGWVLGRVPWVTLIRHAPTIVEAARTYYAATQKTANEREPERRSASGGADALRRAVEQLEQREVEQAALVADLAKQVATMATAIDVLRSRLVVALWLAGGTGVLALLSLVLLLARG